MPRSTGIISAIVRFVYVLSVYAMYEACRETETGMKKESSFFHRRVRTVVCTFTLTSHSANTMCGGLVWIVELIVHSATFGGKKTSLKKVLPLQSLVNNIVKLNGKIKKVDVVKKKRSSWVGV